MKNTSSAEHYGCIYQNVDEVILKLLMSDGKVPVNMIDDKRKYYLLYVRKLGLFQDCIAGKGMWIRNYNRNKEIRKLREVNARTILEIEPNIEIINDKDEWHYWYYGLTIGKLYKVIVSEACMRDCLKACLDEAIVAKNQLMVYDGITDIMFWGTRRKVR